MIIMIMKWDSSLPNYDFEYCGLRWFLSYVYDDVDDDDGDDDYGDDDDGYTLSDNVDPLGNNLLMHRVH